MSVIKFDNVTDGSYVRTFSNVSLVNENSTGECVLDFYEESLDPNLYVVRDLDNEENSKYTNEKGILSVTMKRKATIVINKRQAISMAEEILRQFSTEGDNDGN